MSNNKLIFVVDIRAWAFEQIAMNLASQLSHKFDVHILYWEDYNSAASVIKQINLIDPIIVHFFYREHLGLIIRSSDHKQTSMIDFCSRVITTHIPDYLFSDEVSLISRKDIFNFVDAYFVTNSNLYQLYTEAQHIPPPSSVIFDWPRLTPASQNDKMSDKVIRIIWSGNSKWGEYAGYKDYKGLRSIIEPTIEKVQQIYSDFEFICIDSACSKQPHSVVMRAMEQAHVVLIASEEEGTPLTLLEAMANGCAVITTEVGIAREVLGVKQQRFIVDRSVAAFVAALETLLQDRVILRECGRENIISYQQSFINEGALLDRWLHFFEAASENYKCAGVSRKLSVLPSRRKVVRRVLVKSARWGARVATHLGLVKFLNRTSPQFGRVYQQLVYGSDDKQNYDIISTVYEDVLERIANDEPIVIYSPMWKGVAASTQALFPSNSLAFPFTDAEHPEQIKHPYLEKMAQQLSSCRAREIIYSGGSLIHYKLASIVKKLAPDKIQVFLWHGSPAQWVNSDEKKYFLRWKTAYDSGIISGIISLKPGLDVVLRNLGINSWRLFNPIPVLADDKLTAKLDGSKLKVGVFSAISSWYKNPYPQLLSLAGKDNIDLTTNLSAADVTDVLPRLEKVQYCHHMPRREFLRVLKEQNINLYVTNTECSPMIALESWAYLIPCMVSPAGDIYSSVCEELAYWLVEPRVDDANSISIRIESIINNYDLITELLLAHRDKQRRLFREARSEIYESLRLI